MILNILAVALVAAASYAAAFWSRRLALRLGAVDQPTGGRKIHDKPTALFGGLGIGAVIIAAAALALAWHLFQAKEIHSLQIMGFMAALAILLVGGYLDDRYVLKPSRQIIFPLLAALTVIVTGTGIVQITQWSGHGGWSLVWWRLGPVSLPGDLITLAWLLAVTYATKFLDGLDGLVAGQTVIGAGLIAALALGVTYHQPSVAVLALIVAAAFLGFLPHNINPAKQFLGEAGSTIAGFSLGFLSVVSGTKVAVALMALGLPLADASLVVFGRLARGVSPFRGDDTHLHFKLLKAGLSQRVVVILLWLIALLFGLTALGLQTRGKILLLLGLLGLTLLLSYFAGVMRQSRIPKI